MTTLPQRNVNFIYRWVRALNSDEYSQITKVLKNDRGYCCLGVAAHLAGIPDNMLEHRGSPSAYTFDYEPFANLIPMYECTGITEREFVDWNDISRFSFKDIAEKIVSRVKYREGLFQ